MKLNRIGSFIVLSLALMLILSQSASVTVRAQVSGNFSANLSAQPPSKAKAQRPNDQAPYKVTVQGRLTDPSGNPITSAVNVSFNLYSVPTGGSPTFSEGPVSVTPDNRGLLTYQLGTTSVISPALVSQFANTLYLGLTVGTDAEMVPRILLTAAPYAMSLAPGTVVQGAYDSSVYTTNFGVINGVNTDRSSVTNSGLYGKGTIGVYGEADASGGFGASAGYFTNPGGGSEDQYGVQAQVNSTGGRSGYGGSFINAGGGSGNQYGVIAQANSATGGRSYGGSFSAGGSGSGNQYGVEGMIYSTGSGQGVAGNFTAGSTGQGDQYGVYGSAFAGNAHAYGGYFTAGPTGATIYGIYSSAHTTPNGYSGYFDSNDPNYISVYVYGKVQATGGCCASAAYDTQVQYHGTEPLHIGDVLAADGNNTTIDGTPTLGVVKANASNAYLAVGIVQYRYKNIGKDEKSGRTNWQVDGKATSFSTGDLLSVVILGQVRMKVAGASFGSRITLAADGSVAVASKSADNIIGKVVSQPDKDGYVTVFVNLK